MFFYETQPCIFSANFYEWNSVILEEKHLGCNMFSKYMNYTIVIVISALLAVGLFTAGVSTWLVFTLLMVFTFAISMGYPFYIIYKSRNLKLIGRYLTNHKSKPIFGYAHALAHGTDEEIIHSLNRILKSYANAEVQEVYKANLLFFKKDWRGLIEEAKTMKDPAYKHFYAGIGFAMTSNTEKSSECLSKLGTPWMSHSLKAIIAVKRNELSSFETESALATKHAVGMQRYVVHYMLKRMAGKLK